MNVDVKKAQAAAGIFYCLVDDCPTWTRDGLCKRHEMALTV